MQEPGSKPISIAIAHGDPEAEEKADAALAALPVCPIEKIHCPWWGGGRCSLKRCPAADLDVN